MVPGAELFCHGVDLVEIARLRRAVERRGERFLRRIFTPGELADCGQGAALRFESLAARWAAKEAAAKALGLGLRGLGAVSSSPPGRTLRFLDLEVARGPGGRPELRLHGAAAAAASALGLTHLVLSLSHTREHAVASVIGVGPGPAPQAPPLLLQ